MPSFYYRNKTLVTAAKHYGETNIKVLWFFLYFISLSFRKIVFYLSLLLPKSLPCSLTPSLLNYLPTYLPTHLTACLPLPTYHLPTPTCLPACLPTYLSVFLSVCFLSVHLFFYLSVFSIYYLRVCISIHFT